MAEGQRAGSRALSLFATPLNGRLLRAHAGRERMRLMEAHAAVGAVPESTVRAALANLCEVGALERVRPGPSPRSQATALTAFGEDLLILADELEVWLALAPGGPIELGGEEGSAAVRALASGWSAALVRQLAVGPVTLAELDVPVSGISYPMLERRIAWMREIGLIEGLERQGRAIPYVATDWLRRAIAPLSVSGRCERRHLPEATPPISEVEVESAFLLTLPLTRLPRRAHGTCILVVHTGAGRGLPPAEQLSGVTVEVERGLVESFGTDLVSGPPTWALGTPEAWLDAVIDGELGTLRIGGTAPRLATELVAALHRALFVER